MLNGLQKHTTILIQIHLNSNSFSNIWASKITFSQETCHEGILHSKSNTKKIDVRMEKEKQFLNLEAKSSPKTIESHIHFTYLPYQVG